MSRKDLFKSKTPPEIRIEIGLSHAELAQLQALADQRGVTVEEVIRFYARCAQPNSDWRAP